MKYRLPRELFSEIMFDGDDQVMYEVDNENRRRFEGYLETEAMGLPPHDAFFVITSRSLPWFEAIGKAVRDPAQPNPKPLKYNNVKFKPLYPCFTLHSQLQTANVLQRSNCQWHDIMLNQDHSNLKEVNITADLEIEPEKLREADEWLRDWRKWNPEQRQVIDSIHKAKGGFVITEGIAGTGKTLLQSALGLYFVKLGFKVLMCPPANSNTDQSAKDATSFALAEGEELFNAVTGNSADPVSKPGNSTEPSQSSSQETAQTSLIEKMSSVVLGPSESKP